MEHGPRGLRFSGLREGANSDIASGVEDLKAATDIIIKETGCSSFSFSGQSSGALRAAAFAQAHPDRVARLALGAMVWTGKGSPTVKGAL